MNHVLHGAQLALRWTLKNGVPHFGLLRSVPLTVEYARNFYDSDQRPLRTILARYHGPMIIHGTRDRNVPIAAALEHHKLVPQSQIVELDDVHFMALCTPLRSWIRWCLFERCVLGGHSQARHHRFAGHVPTKVVRAERGKDTLGFTQITPPQPASGKYRQV